MLDHVLILSASMVTSHTGVADPGTIMRRYQKPQSHDDIAITQSLAKQTSTEINDQRERFLPYC